MGTAAGAVHPHAAPRRQPALRRALAAPLTRRAAFLALLVSVPLLPHVLAEPFDYPAIANPWVYLPLSGLFALVLADRRGGEGTWRGRWHAIDVLAFLSLALSLACWRAWRTWPTFLLYALLAYLAVRMLAIAGCGRATARGRVRSPAIPRSWLVLGIALLATVHVAWGLEGGGRVDVGEAGVRGAHAIVSGQPLYGAQGHGSADPHLDTYGPVNYLAYMPFLAFAHGYDLARVTTVFFDLLTALLLFLLGRRLRGPTAGTLLAFCWLAVPLTFYGDMLAFNDSILAATLAGALLVARHPARRGLAAALAVWTKLSPVALVPLLALHDGEGESEGEGEGGAKREGEGEGEGGRRRSARRGVLLFAAAFALVTALAFVPVLAHDGIGTFVSRTVDYQAERAPSQSLWALLQDRYALSAPWLGTLSRVAHGVLVALTGALAIAAAWAPRRRDLVGLAAMAAAIMIALVAGLGYFSFSYLLWFAPLVLVVLALDGVEPVERRTVALQGRGARWGRSARWSQGARWGQGARRGQGACGSQSARR